MDPTLEAIWVLLNGLSAQQQQQAQQATLDAVLQAVNGLNAHLNGVSTQIADLFSLVQFTRTDILSVLANLQFAGAPVTLPTVPPPAYTPPGLSDIGLAVWSYPSAESGQAANDRLDNASFLGVNLGELAFAVQTRFSQYLYLYGTWFSDNPPSLSSPPDVDPRTITADMMTTHDWLQAVYGGPGWSYNADGSSYADTGDGVWWWYVPLTDVDFLALKARALGEGAGATLAPIWPGLAGVTLGSPVPLVDGLNLAGPMAGVLVEITGSRPGVVYVPYGPHQSYRYAAQLAFATDNDDLEDFQVVKWDSGVYLPTSMGVAGRVVFHVSSATVGTVTLFTIP